MLTWLLALPLNFVVSIKIEIKLICILLFVISPEGSLSMMKLQRRIRYHLNGFSRYRLIETAMNQIQNCLYSNLLTCFTIDHPLFSFRSKINKIFLSRKMIFSVCINLILLSFFNYPSVSVSKLKTI